MYLRAKKPRGKSDLPLEILANQPEPPTLSLGLQVRKVNNKMILSVEAETSQIADFLRPMIEECLKDHFRFVCLEEKSAPSESESKKIQKISAYSIDRKSALTEREIEILAKIALGWSNQQIADFFGVTLATIKCHVTSVILKLGVKGRNKAGIEYRRLFEN